MSFFESLATAYLIATLSVTALAKLKMWRGASVGVTRERVIHPRAAVAVILAVSAAEFLLATLFMLGIAPAIAGFAAMILFLAFCGYQIVVVVKTRSLMCSCAGIPRSDPASPPAVAGRTLACLAQASLSCTLAVLGGHITGVFHLLEIAVWTVPIIIFLAGLTRQSSRRDTAGQFPEEFVSNRYDYDFDEVAASG